MEVKTFFCRWPAMCIHGDKSQPEREWVLKGIYFCMKYSFNCLAVLLLVKAANCS